MLLFSCMKHTGPSGRSTQTVNQQNTPDFMPSAGHTYSGIKIFSKTDVGLCNKEGKTTTTSFFDEYKISGVSGFSGSISSPYTRSSRSKSSESELQRYEYEKGIEEDQRRVSDSDLSNIDDNDWYSVHSNINNAVQSLNQLEKRVEAVGPWMMNNHRSAKHDSSSADFVLVKQREQEEALHETSSSDLQSKDAMPSHSPIALHKIAPPPLSTQAKKHAQRQDGPFELPPISK